MMRKDAESLQRITADIILFLVSLANIVCWFLRRTQLSCQLISRRWKTTNLVGFKLACFFELFYITCTLKQLTTARFSSCFCPLYSHSASPLLLSHLSCCFDIFSLLSHRSAHLSLLVSQLSEFSRNLMYR